MILHCGLFLIANWWHWRWGHTSCDPAGRWSAPMGVFLVVVSAVVALVGLAPARARAVAESARAPDGDANDAYAEGASAAAFSRRRAMASWSAVRRFASRLRACHHLARLAGVASAASMVASMDGW